MSEWIIRGLRCPGGERWDALRVSDGAATQLMGVDILTVNSRLDAALLLRREVMARDPAATFSANDGRFAVPWGGSPKCVLDTTEFVARMNEA